MFDENDSESSIGVAIALAVAIFAALFAIGIATGTSLGLFAGKPAKPVAGTAAPVGAMVAPSAAAAAPAAAMVTEARLYFDLAKYELPTDALTKLAPLVSSLRLKDGAKLLVSGYHDASGNAAANAELARQRAFAVRDLLTTAGVPSDRIELAKPMVTTGGSDAHEARRVDVTLR